MAAGSILGIILTFAPSGLYPAYVQPVDPHGVLKLVREGWGLSPHDDQQLGGLLMWIPGGMLYLLPVIRVLARWYGEADVDTMPAHGRGDTGRGVPVARL